VEKAVAAHLSRNAALLESLNAKGVDPLERRPIDLHFWASTEAAARALSQALDRQGFATQVNSAGSAWNIEAQFNGSITEVTAVGFVERYVRLAAQHSGDFDGWGTAV
jgi:hypothetical protein